MRRVVFVALVSFASATAHAAPPGDRADRVSRLRIEVDEIAERLRDQRRRAQDDLAALHAERADLERQLRLEQIRSQTLSQLAQERRDRAMGLEDGTEKWRDPIRQAVAKAKAHVHVSLPYKAVERLEQLQRIERELEGQHPDLSGALSRLWRFVEEEEALGRETGRAQQTVSIGGERRLVDVVHVSMALMYFRATDGRLGWARPNGDAGWRFEWLEDDEAKVIVESLFAAFETNRVQGPQRVLVYEGAPK